MKEARFLTVEEVIEIHTDLIERCGGTHGIRDIGLLQSAVAMPQSGFGDRYLHADLFEMAAAYLFHLVQNHPFVDGNQAHCRADCVHLPFFFADALFAAALTFAL